MTKPTHRAQPVPRGREGRGGPILAAALVWIRRADGDVMSLQEITESRAGIADAGAEHRQQAG